MTAHRCDQLALADLADYAAGELSGTEAAALEEHLFSCADCSARAAEFEALVRAVRPAVRSAEVGGIVTEAVLNQLAREGMRMRTYSLWPDAVVPCAVWDDDELMVLRLRADFGDASDFALSQRIEGTEVSRATGRVANTAHGEIIFVQPASVIRELPAVELDVVLSVLQRDQERPIARYTLVHGGALHR